MYLSSNGRIYGRMRNARDVWPNSKYSAGRFEEYDHKPMLDCGSSISELVGPCPDSLSARIERGLRTIWYGIAVASLNPGRSKF
jgi:hypothetical protein